MARLSYAQIQLITNIVNQFEIDEGTIDIIELFGAGRINQTFKITLRNGEKRIEYLLQNVNHFVFPNTKELMENLTMVTEYIRQHGGRSVQYIKCKKTTKMINGPYIYIDNTMNHRHWRMYNYIDADVYPCIINPHHAYKLGEAIASFYKSLDGFDTHQLRDTIPDFHNTPKRFEALAVSGLLDSVNDVNRMADVKEEIKFVVERRDKLGIIMDALEKGEIPYRVCHNDPKLSNVLFDKQKNTPICMIDLDTIMPGSCLFDVGDAIRSIANMASEDDKTTENVSLSVELYEEFVKGYLDGMGDKLIDKEKKLIPMAVWVITMELGIRFLKDHIDRNVYFKIERDGENLERARIQFALAKDIERKIQEGKLNKILDVH
ncbi:MAG: aminoglycoside phosphotransferase family protein [Clostridia bacterium]|nr:aminoglycoside phosphotransferase family protein [Clostridia bacterium]